MAHFVLHDVAQQLTHQVVVEWEETGSRIDRRRLSEVRHELGSQRVLIEPNVRAQSLSRARILNAGSRGVLHGRRKPADHGVPCVLKGPVGIVRRIQREDRVAEPGLLEGFLPVFHTRLEVWDPPFGHSRIDIVDDRLDRVRDRRGRVLLLEPIPSDVACLLDLLILGRVVDEAGGEVAHSVVAQAALHRHVWEEVEAPAHDHCVGWVVVAASLKTARRRRAAVRERERRVHVHVVGVGYRPVDPRAVVVDVAWDASA